MNFNTFNMTNMHDSGKMVVGEIVVGEIVVVETEVGKSAGRHFS